MKGKQKIKKKDIPKSTDLDDGDWSYPKWVNAEKTSTWERIELFTFRFITYVPVIITFCLFGFLLTFYIYCFLYPCLIGDFYGTLGISDYWATSADKENDKYWAQILACIVGFCVINLFFAIVLTIVTNPGSIPIDTEWDMPDDQFLPEEEIQETRTPQEDFNNQEILEDQQDPKEPSHFDYRFIKSKAGPIYYQENEELIKKPKKPVLQVQSFERKKFGGIRMCARCLRTKPDRTHHCSQCNKCVLKMDHHCPWVANCIGFYNYKYFLNMLFYASLTSLIVVITAYPVFLAVLAHDGMDYKLAYFVITAYILAIALCFLLTGFFSFHLWLLSNQYTTIEYCEKRSNDSQFKQKSPYNRGCCANFQAVLGKNCILWCFPCNRNLTGQGLQFEIRDELKPKPEPEPEEQKSGENTPGEDQSKQSEAKEGGEPEDLRKTSVV